MTLHSIIDTTERALIRGTRIPRDQLASLQDWLPVTVSADPPGVWWRYLGDKQFTESFFSDTLQTLPMDQRLCCLTDFAALSEFSDCLAPSAFIFHVSRCGSTLLTQLLSSLPQCVALSEPPVIDSFLRMYRADPDAENRHGGIDTLRRLITALGQRRDPRHRKLFIKMDSWHLRDMALIRAAFPQTPCLFLYRRPDQVLASHRRQRGPQMVPGMMDGKWLGIAPDALAPADLDGFCLRTLEAYFRAALADAQSHPLLLVNYSELPEIVADRLLASFDIDCSEAELASLKRRAGFHSKHDGIAFQGDPPAVSGGDPDAGGNAGSAAFSLYEALEQLRVRP